LVRIIRIESWRQRIGLSLRQVSEAEWEAWVARSERPVQEKGPEAARDIETDEIEPAGEDATASGQDEQSEAGLDHTPSAEPEEEMAAAQIGESRENDTSASDHVEEEPPGERSIEESVPVSEGFWASFVEAG